MGFSRLGGKFASNYVSHPVGDQLCRLCRQRHRVGRQFFYVQLSDQCRRFYIGFNGGPYGSGEQNTGFQAFNSVQQAATASILNMYSAVANVTFTQIAETSTQSADLRYAESNQPSTAWGYYPSVSPEGGDAWFNSSSGWYDNPVLGNYAWLTIIHETGHLLGLKHPQDASGSFGAVPVSANSLEYTVMSYRSYIGASTTQGLTNATWSFPQTLMLYDIAALQYMYGANYNTNSGDTVYKWNASTGQETINGVARPLLAATRSS